MQPNLVLLVLIFKFNISKCSFGHKQEIAVDNLHLKNAPPLAELTLRSFSKTNNLKDNSKSYYFWQNKVHLQIADNYRWDFTDGQSTILLIPTLFEDTNLVEAESVQARKGADLLLKNQSIINLPHHKLIYIPELKKAFNETQIYVYNINKLIYEKHNPVNICLTEYAKFKSRNNGTSLANITEYCPNVCNSMPCARTPNAFEYSCQTLVNKKKLKSVVLGKPTNIQLENFRKKFSHLFEMITLDYKCDCYDNYFWVVNSDNNGGTCLPIESSCDSINCGIGKCILTKSDYTNSKIAKCLCPPAFTGKYCELRHDPCLNDRNSCGRFPCVRDSSNLKYGYYCLCDRGYKMVYKHKNGSLTEPHCEDENECEGINSPCLNNSTCVNLNSTYKCICLNEEYYEQNCEYKLNEEMLIKWGSWQRWGSCLISQQDDYLRCTGLQLSFRKCLYKEKHNVDDRKCLGVNTRKRKCFYSKCNYHSKHVVEDILVVFDGFNL